MSAESVVEEAGMANGHPVLPPSWLGTVASVLGPGGRPVLVRVRDYVDPTTMLVTPGGFARLARDLHGERRARHALHVMAQLLSRAAETAALASQAAARAVHRLQAQTDESPDAWPHLGRAWDVANDRRHREKMLSQSATMMTSAIAWLRLDGGKKARSLPPPAHRATRSTRGRTITRTASATKTASASSSGGGGGASGGDDGPQLGDGDPPRPLRPRHGWHARHGRREDLTCALVARVRALWGRRARAHHRPRMFARAYVPRPVTGGER